MKKNIEVFIFSIFIGISQLFFQSLFGQQFDLSDSTNTEKDIYKPQKRFFDRDKVFVGGGIGGGFGSGAGMIQVAPLVGYSLTENFQTALKVTYTYIYGSEPNTLQTFSDHIIAGSLINRYVIWRGVFAQVEPEIMNRKAYAIQTSPAGAEELISKRINAFNLYVGGGAYLDFTSNSGGFILLLYNLNQTPNSFYRNPHIQGGFTFGF